MIRIQYVCSECGAFEPCLPSRASAITCRKCNHIEEIPAPTNLKENVLVPTGDHEQLMKDQAFLSCLDACGVDNWSGYGDAQAMFNEEEDEEEDLSEDSGA